MTVVPGNITFYMPQKGLQVVVAVRLTSQQIVTEMMLLFHNRIEWRHSFAA